LNARLCATNGAPDDRRSSRIDEYRCAMRLREKGVNLASFPVERQGMGTRFRGLNRDDL
jgi:hypothetical protein